jgi:hypothetical protein
MKVNFASGNGTNIYCDSEFCGMHQVANPSRFELEKVKFLGATGHWQSSEVSSAFLFFSSPNSTHSLHVCVWSVIDSQFQQRTTKSCFGVKDPTFSIENYEKASFAVLNKVEAVYEMLVHHSKYAHSYSMRVRNDKYEWVRTLHLAQVPVRQVPSFSNLFVLHTVRS